MTESIWTERLLRMPHALAARHATPGTDAHEELVAHLNYRMVQLAASWKPDGGQAFASYLYTYLQRDAAEGAGTLLPRRGNSRVKELRHVGLARLDAPAIAGGGTPLGALLASPEPSPEGTAEADDALAAALKKLPPIRRAVFVLRFGRGTPCREIAAYFGVARQTVQDWIAGDAKRLRRYAARLDSGAESRRARGNLKAAAPPVSDDQKRAAAKHCRDMATARRLLGDVPRGKWVWYVADEGAKTLLGPGKLAAVLAAAGVPLLGRGAGERAAASLYEGAVAAMGLRIVRGPEAPALARDGYRLVEIEGGQP